MTEEITGGAAASTASHCAAKSGGPASPASGATGGPHCARKRRRASSAAGSRAGAGSGTQRLIWKPSAPPARRSAAQAAIASGRISSAPQAPSPPALATAMDSDGGQAPAMGASRIGARRP